MLYRIKVIISTGEPNDPLAVQQITDVFDFFLEKLCSDKPNVRQGALKILNKLFTTIVDSSAPVDLNELLDSFRLLPAYDAHVRHLVVKHFRRFLGVETNPVYLRTCVHYLFQQQLLTDTSDKSLHNDVSLDLADFFLKRDYYLNISHLLPAEFHPQVHDYVTRTFKLNELEPGHELVSSPRPFDRHSPELNSYLLVQLQQQFFVYLHEKQFNLLVYLIVCAGLDDLLPDIKLLNCDFNAGLGELLKRKLFRLESNSPGVRTLIGELLKSTGFDHLVELLVTQYGLSTLTVTLAAERIQSMSGVEFETLINRTCEYLRLNLNQLADALETRLRTVAESSRLVELIRQVRAKYGRDRVEPTSESSLFRLNRKRTVKSVNRSNVNNTNMDGIRAEVERYRQERRSVDTPMEVANMETAEDEQHTHDALMSLIGRSSNQNLEVNMNRTLNDLKSTSTRIESLVRTLLAYETSKQEKCIKRLNSNSRIIKSEQSLSVTYKRCVIDILLDYFCHFDAQIVSERHFDAEFRLLFEMRNVSESAAWHSHIAASSTSLIQSFLLSLFIHQASWTNLFTCVNMLFDGHRLFAGISANPNLK